MNTKNLYPFLSAFILLIVLSFGFQNCSSKFKAHLNLDSQNNGSKNNVGFCADPSFKDRPDCIPDPGEENLINETCDDPYWKATHVECLDDPTLLPSCANVEAVIATNTAAGHRIVRVKNISELRSAINNLSNKTTIVLSKGTYKLTNHLNINRDHVTLVGDTGNREDVIIEGQGMDKYPGDNGFAHGIYTEKSHLSIFNLTIKEVWNHTVALQASADNPHICNVNLIDSGEQFIKGSSNTSGIGSDDGIVEFTQMFYTNGPSMSNDRKSKGYTNGVDIHGGKNWIIRNNVFKDFHAGDASDNPFAPAVLMWNGSENTVTTNNIFINVERAIAYGLEKNSRPYHKNGIISNNMIYYKPNLNSSHRKSNSDGAIIIWGSTNTKVYHNTIITNGNHKYSIQFRFGDSITGGEAKNNLMDTGINLRGSDVTSSKVTVSNNLTLNQFNFLNEPLGDLHLSEDLPSSQKVHSLGVVKDNLSNIIFDGFDFDGDPRSGSLVAPGADEYITP